MTTDDIRSLILRQMDRLGISRHHAARLAGLSDQTARDYLAGDRDMAAGRVLALAAAVGLRVSAAPVPGYAPPVPAPAGRPKNNPGKAGH